MRGSSENQARLAIIFRGKGSNQCDIYVQTDMRWDELLPIKLYPRCISEVMRMATQVSALTTSIIIDGV